ncbi:TauD/TfdA family dioxygenase [Burkholderia thailandensis]|uniref:TauD/TfdA family dioxygenase n=1 Tax=Burkholderia thailandensis TaxID=57975 RepID=UPI0012FD04AB|nr:TauD/TfdA family dioxygenase [Burkholderia thailandensis]
MFLLRMLTRDVLRWDSLFLSPKNESARKVAKLMAELDIELLAHDIFLSEPGHTVLLDNWRVLHGRSAVPSTDVGRSLDRVYLDLLENGDQNSA